MRAAPLHPRLTLTLYRDAPSGKRPAGERKVKRRRRPTSRVATLLVGWSGDPSAREESAEAGLELDRDF